MDASFPIVWHPPDGACPPVLVSVPHYGTLPLPQPHEVVVHDDDRDDGERHDREEEPAADGEIHQRAVDLDGFTISLANASSASQS